MGINNGKYGYLFQQVFLTMLDEEGLKEGEDYVRGIAPDPDYFFPKINSYIEVKFTSNNMIRYSNAQKNRFEELRKQGFKIKTIVFRFSIENPFENDRISLNKFIEKIQKP